MRALLDAVTATKLDKSHIRFLGPDYRDNINRLYSRRKTGVKLRVSQNVRNSDLRFQVADSRNVVITIGVASEPSRKGYLIESAFLGSILTEWFNMQWKNSRDYEVFIKEQVFDICKVGEIGDMDFHGKCEYISVRLGLEFAEVTRVMKELITDGDHAVDQMEDSTPPT